MHLFGPLWSTCQQKSQNSWRLERILCGWACALQPTGSTWVMVLGVNRRRPSAGSSLSMAHAPHNLAKEGSVELAASSHVPAVCNI